MATVQMNVRIDAQLKDDVDAVLRGSGVSASDVVRSLWAYIADRRQVPRLETSAEERAREEERRRRMTIVEDSAGCLQRELAAAGVADGPADPFASAFGGMTSKQIRDAMYDQMLDDYLAMERSE
ncbi:type II toxin-antitoxin system RelB/DinJ family antitoxin [Bifidobacterium stellenboschense]|uniref:DNA-damage-inducible protein J n=1 Tax=Bifidobacterium stellenboschense TaxID=762211 RepID=A0A087DPV5_9BIFI|nr:type II toxin-antitoxin system RelB/DinJ family antitoxin [Bifidobacterium stellenboschense]KFI97555.1 DNA-damage-inducible protein J [Bifidobacterium stellenboschense]